MLIWRNLKMKRENNQSIVTDFFNLIKNTSFQYGKVYLKVLNMALIKCPECGKEISDKSKQCIHCGFPLELLPPQPAESDRVPLVTFVRRSCVGGIVSFGIVLEIIYPAIIVGLCFMGSSGYVMAAFFGAVYLAFSIYAPFGIIKTIKQNVKANAYRGKNVIFDKSNNSFIFEQPEESENLTLLNKDIIGFDGPNTLKVTYMSNGHKKFANFGYTTRKDVVKLRNIHKEIKQKIDDKIISI